MCTLFTMDGYKGESIWPLMKELGSTFDFHFFWERLAFTVEPEIIKVRIKRLICTYEN